MGIRVDPSRQAWATRGVTWGIWQEEGTPATLSVGASHPSKGLGHMPGWGIVGTGGAGLRVKQRSQVCACMCETGHVGMPACAPQALMHHRLLSHTSRG